MILFVICVSCLSFLSYCLVLWSPDLLALLCVMFSCVFVTSPDGVLGQV